MDQETGEEEKEELENPNVSGVPLITLRPEIQVPRKNKIISTIAFFCLIIATLAFLIGLIVLNIQKSATIQRFVIDSTFDLYYAVYAVDIIASSVGIWTCLARTGSCPMIGACLTLCLTALGNVFLPIEIFIAVGESDQPQQTGTPKMLEDCQKFGSSVECKELKSISYIFWGTYVVIVLKIAVIAICRFSYPHVFNWTHEHDQIIHRSSSILITSSGQSIHEVHSQTIAPGMFFAPVDLNRMSLRGSLTEGEVYKSTRHGSIFYPVGGSSTRSSIVSGRASISSHGHPVTGSSLTSVKDPAAGSSPRGSAAGKI